MTTFSLDHTPLGTQTTLPNWLAVMFSIIVLAISDPFFLLVHISSKVRRNALRARFLARVIKIVALAAIVAGLFENTRLVFGA